MKNKIISILLIVLLVIPTSINVFADEIDTINEGIVKIAYVEDIDIDGSNIGNDILNRGAILESTDYDVDFLISDQNLEFNGNVDGMPISVSGTIATTNENSNLLLYEQNETLEDFQVLYMSVERELDETALYFLKFHESNPIYQNVVKMYLQPTGTRDIIFIEIFIVDDFVDMFLQNNSVVYDNEIANTIQSWFVSIYEPITENTEADAIAPASANNTRAIDLSKTYTLNGSSVTYKFTVNVFYNVPDITKNGNGTASFCFEVATSKTTSDLEANNSSTQNVLRLEDANITVTTYPNIVCTSVTSTRSKIQKNGSISNSFSVSFGYSYASLSATGSFSYNKTGTLTSNSDTKILTKSDSKGTRKIETGELPSNYYLQKKGSQYGFNLILQDMKGTARTGNISVVFDYYVNNLYKYSDSKTGTRSYSLSMSVK